MSLLIHALTLADLAGLHIRALAAGVPNPAPAAPPGLSNTVNTLLAWWKWLAMIAGVFGLVGCGAMMAIGRRRRRRRRRRRTLMLTAFLALMGTVLVLLHTQAQPRRGSTAIPADVMSPA